MELILIGHRDILEAIHGNTDLYPKREGPLHENNELCVTRFFGGSSNSTHLNLAGPPVYT